MTCGTGAQVFWLAEHGYTVTGVDFSPDLLVIAREKAQYSKHDIRFVDGDVRTVTVDSGTLVDAVITIGNAVGHMTKHGFGKALRNIHRHVRDGGLYVFDICNAEAMTDAVVAGFSQYHKIDVDDTQLHVVQCSTFDATTGCLTSVDHCIMQTLGGPPRTRVSRFSLQLYGASELQHMLRAHGFEVITCCSTDGTPYVAHRTTSLFVVAKKQ
jgi:ubiquinone/menaquinone biosynthesis C-methylase UbiE